MFLLIFLAYKSTTTLKSSHPAAFSSDFGFIKNGTYSITTSSNNMICFTFIKTNEYRDYRNRIVNDQISCSNINGTQYYQEFDSMNGLNGIVSEEGIFYPLFISMEGSSINMKITEIYRNLPDSYMDSRWFGIINSKIAVVVILAVIMILWLINWFMHFKIQIWIHYCLTAVFISNLIYQIIRFSELVKLDKADTATGLSIFRVIIFLISEIIFYATILFLAKGWCIVRDSISVKEIILCLIYSTLFMIFRSVSEYVLTGTWAIVVLICALISLILFIRELMVSLNYAHMLIFAHLLSISNAGYDAKTTPIYKKYVLYQSFQFAFLGALVLLLIYLIVAIFVEVPFYIQETIEDIIEILFLGVLAFLFQLRGTNRTNYTLMPEEPSEQTTADEYSLADIETVSRHSDIFTRGGKVWTEEMPLPSAPVVTPRRRPELLQSFIHHREPPQPQQSEVILSSPDGVETVNAQLLDDQEHKTEI